MDHNPSRMGFLAALLVLAALTAGAGAQPAPLDIPASERSGGLSQQSLAQIDAWLDHFAERLRQAEDPAEMVGVREELLGQFNRYEDAGLYQYEYAARAAERLLPLLDEQSQLIQVHAGIILSRLAQVSIQPALERMVTDDSPAVRYLGWVGDDGEGGYHGIRIRVMAQSRAAMDTMFASLERAGGEEPVGPVLGAVFQVLDLPVTRPVVVNQSTYARARRQGLEILRSVWSQRCRQVLAGEEEIAGACRKGVLAVRSLFTPMDADAELRTAVLQMLVDVAWCGARAWSDLMARVTAARDTGLSDSRLGMVIDEVRPGLLINGMLLRTVEDVLNELTGERRRHLSTPLNRRDPSPTLGDDVIQGVQAWIDELRAQGVEQPDVQAPAPEADGV